MITDARADEVRRIRASVTAWARAQTDIVGAAVVGSWARAVARMDSDIDLVVVTLEKDRYVETDDWVTEAVGRHGDIVRTEEWGPLTERRVRLPSGLDVEFGVVAPSWAATDPLDPGTARVVLDGCIPLVDKEGLFERLLGVF